MTGKERILKYGPLLFGIPIAVLVFLEQWRDVRGDAWVSQMASAKFAIELSISIVIGYVGGALFAWLWEALMRGAIGWRDRNS